ncbi:MAG TPA: glycosyltransferase [Ignavibacteriaceae bacterium]|nr:glycosyltransferase [Ignavibacteriaceae bacterium]
MNIVLPLLVLFLFLLIVYSTFLIGINAGLRRIINDPIKNKETANNTSGNNPYKASVIIPFRNESENILNSLKCIEQQDYPKDLFEVIYVNDSSSDDSFEKLSNAEKSCNIKIISSYGEGLQAAFKKFALRKGIESSAGEIIITTDADTMFGRKWLSSLLEKFEENTGLISGPVNFIFGHGLFSAFQILEFSGLVLTGAGLIGINQPVICNGANLAYRRKAYDGVKGFTEHLHLSSGEDELLMQSISNDTFYKIKFSWDKDSLVSTNPPLTLREFFQQRKRWASKALYYPDKLLRFRLFLVFLFYLGIPVQFLLIFFSSKLFLLSFIITLAVKLILEYSIIKTGKDFLFPRKILKHFLAAELIQIPYILIYALAGISGKFEWIGRKLKR